MPNETGQTANQKRPIQIQDSNDKVDRRLGPGFTFLERHRNCINENTRWEDLNVKQQAEVVKDYAASILRGEPDQRLG